MTNIAIFANAGDFGDLDGDPTLPGGETLTTTPIAFDFELGTAPFFSTVLPDGTVFMGSDSLTDNEVNSTFTGQSVAWYIPSTGEFTSLPLPTTAGNYEALAQNGITGGADVCDVGVATIARRQVPVAVCSVDYHQWLLAEGRFRCWLVFESDGAGGWQLDEARSKTADELAEVPTIGILAFPTTTNVHGETYHIDKGLCEIGEPFRQSGHIPVTFYFKQPGMRSGAVGVIDPETSTLVAWYGLPDFTCSDGTTPDVSPRTIATDPTSVRGAEVFGVIPDVIVGLSGIGFPVHEFAYDADEPDPTQRITPTCAPFIPILDDDSVPFLTYDGRCNALVYGEDGALWVATSRGIGFPAFNSLSYAVWAKTPGVDRSYITSAPTVAGYQNNYPVRVLPDWFLGSTIQTGGVARGITTEPLTGGVVVIGNNGVVSSWHPDFPLVDRANLYTNDFTSDIVGVANVAGSCGVSWDSGDGGRLKVTASGGAFTAATCEVAGLTLPADCEGQSFLCRIPFRCGSVARTFQAAARFRDSGGNSLGGLNTGPAIQGVIGATGTCYFSSRIPVGAVTVDIDFKINGAAALEVHYALNMYGALAPVTHHARVDLALSDLTAGQPGKFQIRGAALDPDRRLLWFVLQQLETTNTCAAYPCVPYSLPQWLFSADIDWLFGDPTAAELESRADTATELESSTDSTAELVSSSRGF